MRRKDKYLVNGAILGIATVSLIDILLQWSEHKEVGQQLTWERFDGLRTIRRAISGGVVGAGVGYAIYQYKVHLESKQAFCSDTYLRQLLLSENLKADPEMFEKVLLARNEIKTWLWGEFKQDLVLFPEDTGSYFKRTAIRSNFDLDIILPFKRNSYQSLKDMYWHVFETIYAEFGSCADISVQSKAIGLTIDCDGQSVHFDIVPGREIKNYKVDRDLNLFVQPGWFWQNGNRFKTNSKVQKRATVNNPEARKAIRLLKKYNNENGLKIPSTVIEQYTIIALSQMNYDQCRSETEYLLHSMDYISRKITQKALLDVANSNNNLHEKIKFYDRQNIASQLDRDIKKIKKNPRYIVEVFGKRL